MAVLGSGAASKTILITESPIDALSYRQLHLHESSSDSLEKDELDRTMYLSTCGNLTAGIKKELAQVFQAAAQQGQEVVLALDNDQAGAKMTKELAHVLEEKGCSYKIEQPAIGKDWNESLLISNNPESIEYAQLQGCLAQEYLDTFQSVNHEQSLLHDAGIKEIVYRDATECKELAQVFQAATQQGQEVVLALDNDAVMQLKELLREKACTYRVQYTVREPVLE